MEEPVAQVYLRANIRHITRQAGLAVAMEVEVLPAAQAAVAGTVQIYQSPAEHRLT